MRIHHIHISNFRRLKNCRIDFDKEQTILIGANNSGKTSAITAFTWFLERRSNFTVREFTLTNWKSINSIGLKWIAASVAEEHEETPITIEEWNDLLPSLDVWIEVSDEEIFRVSHMIPSLSWKGGLVGVRYRFEPKDITELYSQYLEFYRNIEELKDTEKGKSHKKLEIYNNTLFDFLSKESRLKLFFDIKSYILNSDAIKDDEIQETPSIQAEEDPLKGLVRIDTIEAYRKFSDPEGQDSDARGTLSKQLQDFYSDNISPSERILTESDIQLLATIEAAGESLDKELTDKFNPRISELSGLNYPGFQNPDIEIHSHIDPSKAIQHESAVRYKVNSDTDITLPEKYNGLGYQNLLSIYFKLMQFRENWIHNRKNEDETVIEPIHLVFIEEPEAHLHVQAQQVFIRKAFETLNNDKFLKDNEQYHTQLIVSTHSTHIVHEEPFECLRYFKRGREHKTRLPISKVINLTETFGNDKETEEFVTRYIRLNDCDIFFADAVILVEGSAERILMPHFLKECGLDKFYIAILEINGAHAHKLRPLIEKLRIICLVVTDIDSEKDGGKILPKIGDGQETNNDTIKNWLPKKNSIDDLEKLTAEDKIVNEVRVAYQTKIKIDDNGKVFSVFPYTFEDALAFSNYTLFKSTENKGMAFLTKIQTLFSSDEKISKIHDSIFNALKTSSVKARFATDLMCTADFESLATPEYIKEGLNWIEAELIKK